MSSVISTISLTELTFPDCTQKTIRAFGTVSFSAGTYLVGGLSMGLLLFADQRTVDFNGFLVCRVIGDNPTTPGTVYSYRYSPVGDVLQVYLNGTELTAGTTLPAAVTGDTVVFEATWDRTTTRG
jgi:hypothetical protein